MKKKFMVIAICYYFIANCAITYFLTTQPLNEYFSSFQRSFLSEVCCIIGNLSILTILLIILFSFVKKGNRRVLGMGIISLALGIIIFVLKIYIKYYETSFSFQTLTVFKNPAANLGMSILLESLKEFIFKGGFLPLLPGFLLIGYSIYLGKINYSFNFATTKISYLFKTTITLVSLVASISCYMIFINVAAIKWPYDNDVISYGIQFSGVYNYYIYDAFGVSFENVSDEAQINEIENDILKFNKNGEHTNILDGKVYEDPFSEKYSIFEDKNLYVVHLESVNNFILGLEIDGVEIAPNLNALYDNENVFMLNKLFTNSGQGVSADAELSVMTGIPANGSSTLHWDLEDTPFDFDCLPELFKEKYPESTVMSFHGDIRAFYNREPVHEGLFGFDKYFSLENYIDEHKDATPDKFVNGWVSDAEMFNWVEEHINTTEGQYFFYNVLTVSHTPFLHNPMEDLIDINLESEILERYLKYMVYVDEIIGKFIEDKKDDTDTLFYFYGDHGCGINDGSLEELFPELSKLELSALLRQDVGFFYDPSGKLNEMLGGVMETDLLRSHIDAYTTLCSLFGLRPSTITYGVNIFSDEPTFGYNPVSFYIFTDEYYYSIKRPGEAVVFTNITSEELKRQIELIKLFKKLNDGAIKFNLIKDIKA